MTKKIKLLFQGDSITDAGRDRSNIRNLGFGYSKYAAELLQNAYPDIQFDFMNTGISGDRAESLLARWDTDALALEPDVVSILIGVNDTWHRDAAGNWMTEEYFESCYRSILAALKEKTHAKIIMLEQFLLFVPSGSVHPAEFRADLDRKIQITRKLAREFADVFVPLDGLFAAASVGCSPEKWAADGVHPTADGAKFIAQHYLNAFRQLGF
jgi:acyl-CoA thioesterase-1